MKILSVPSDNNLVSGAFRSMVTLNKILQQKYDVQILVVLPNRFGNGSLLLDEYNIKYVFIDSFNWIVKSDRELTHAQHDQFLLEKEKNENAIKQLVELIKKEHIDIIHINTTYSYVAAIAGLITRTPIVWHLREFLEEDQKRRIYDREYGYKTIGKADCIITISQALYKKYENILPKEKMRVVYNGIDTSVFYNPKKEIFKKNKLIFVCVGSVNYNKGQDLLVHACGKLFKYKKITDFELWLVGVCDDRYTGIINNVAKKYGIEDKVKILGPKKNVAEYYASADIAFMCSKFEAFGRVTVEGMLSGALMIGANTGGTVEIIRDQETGLLYNQGDSDDLCEKIFYALNHKPQMQIIAASGREDMYKNMNAERNANEVYNIYKEVLVRHKNAKVFAVIVTYNRLSMLKLCLDAVLKQTYQSLDVVVVDNASTDGTGEYVRNLKNKRIIYINTHKNSGGAGGFYRGIKEAYIKGAKWVWVMDDDVIPSMNALEELMQALKVVKPNKTSFLASCVYGPNGESMNTPGVDLRSKNGYPYWYEYLDKGLVKINAATFVSILINSVAIEKCGLPCSNFFIWGDDSEYTKRLYRNFGLAYLVGKSKVTHLRSSAKNLTIFNEDNKSRVPLYSYMIRNTLIYTREYAGEDAFNQKLTLFHDDCEKLIKSDDLLKDMKVAAIENGIKNYYKYDFEAFEHRFEIFYSNSKKDDTNTYAEIPIQDKKQTKAIKKKNKIKDIVFWGPRKIKKAWIFWKKYGTKATIRRILMGKKYYNE